MRYGPLLLACGWLSGCGLTATHEPLEHALINNPAAQTALPGVAGQAWSQGPLPHHWWRLYRDPALDLLIEQARAANTSLRVANAALLQAKAQQDRVAAEGQPEVGASFGADYAQVSGEQYLLSNVVPTMALYDTGLSASYQLDLFGRVKHAEEAAGAHSDAVQAVRDTVGISVVAEVAQAYVQVCTANQALGLAREQLALQGRLVELTHRLQQAGRAVDLDVIKAKAGRDDVAASMPVLQARHDAGLLQLAALTGRVRADFPASVTQCAAPPRLIAAIPVGDGAALLRRRPDLRAAERMLAAATAQISVAKADLYPQISLGASLGSTGKLSDFLTPPTNFWGLGPQISWNLNQTAVRAEIRAAGAGQQMALAKFDGAVLAAVREAATAISNENQDQARLDVLVQTEARAERAGQEAAMLFQAGKVDEMMPLQVHRAQLAAQAAVLAGQAKLASDQVALFLALGGGWE